MSFQITHTTTDSQIDNLSKDELYVLLGRSSRTEKKVEMAAFAKTIRNNKKNMHDEMVARDEAQRLDVLSREVAAGRVKMVLENLRKGLEYVKIAPMKDIASFRARVIASDDASLNWNMNSDIEDAMYASCLLHEVAALVYYVDRQIAEQTHTSEQMLEHMVEDRDSRINRCVNDDDFRHNSTSSVSNIHNIQQARARQATARLMRNVVKALAKDFKSNDEVGHCAHVSTSQYLF